MSKPSGQIIAIPGTVEPLVEPISPDRLLDGAPMTETMNAYQWGGQTHVGEWASTPGAWRVSYDEWEFCHILTGRCELIADGGQPVRFSAGDSFVIEPGFVGVWRVLETVRKRYVIWSDT